MEPDLVQLACRGDEAAYQSIVEHNQEAVFRLAYLILGDADDAQDVAQETFIRALRSLHRFDSSRPLRPWLLRITANLARNRRRALGRYWKALRRFAGQVPEGADVEAQSAQQAEAVELWRAIRHLKRPEQEVIYLRYFLELSTEEVADALNTPPGTVKSRLHRALKKLQGVIERDFPHLQEGRAA